MALTADQIEQQKKQAEELLFSGPQKLGFAKALFFGQFNGGLLFPYPELRADKRDAVQKTVAAVREFCDTSLDAAAVDRDALIPQSVIDGLGQLGVLGLTAPTE